MLERTLLQMLKESRYTTVLSGYEMLLENGYPAIRDGSESYDIEAKYGFSLEEMFSSGFYSTRKEQFFEFYRNEILSSLDIPPGKGFVDLAKLQQKGLIQSVITRRIYGLPGRAGCQNVINLHGSVYENHCPSCGRKYPVEYIRQAGAAVRALSRAHPAGCMLFWRDGGQQCDHPGGGGGAEGGPSDCSGNQPEHLSVHPAGELL